MGNGAPIEGAWLVREYVVGGTPTPVEGLLIFAEGRWATVFFVPAGSPDPAGNGEAGEYVLEGNALTFTHRHTVEAAPGRDLVIIPRNDRVERCQASIDASTLTIAFPSGNTLRLARVPRA